MRKRKSRNPPASALEAEEVRGLPTPREEEGWEADDLSAQASRNEVSEAQREPQPHSSLNPDASEFNSDHSGLWDPENNLSHTQGRLQRRRARPSLTLC